MSSKLTRRQFLITTGGVVGAAALAACVPVAETSAPAEGAEMALPDNLVEIEYWHRQSGDTALLLEDLAAEFNAANEGQVSVTAIAQGSIQELNQKVRAAAAGGGMPGALMGDDYDITQYAFSNILQDLDPYIEDPEHGLTQAQIDDILPGQYNRHKLEIYNNERYSFPIAFSAFATFWNEDLLANAGMETPPASWDEFPDYVRTASAANGDIPGWLISGAGDRFISCLLTYGVEWQKEGGEESNFDAPEALEIMSWWRELSDEGLLAVTREARDLYIAQQNLTYMDSSANANRFHATVEEFAWNGGLPPQRHDGDPVTETYGPVNTVPKTSPEEQLAGWMWLKFLIEPDVHARYVAQTSYFPSTRSAVDTELLQGIYSENTIARRMIDDVSVHARILAPSPALPEIRGVITANVVEEVLLGQLSPEEGVRKLKAEADDAIRNAML